MASRAQHCMRGAETLALDERRGIGRKRFASASTAP